MRVNAKTDTTDNTNRQRRSARTSAREEKKHGKEESMKYREPGNRGNWLELKEPATGVMCGVRPIMVLPVPHLEAMCGDGAAVDTCWLPASQTARGIAPWIYGPGLADWPHARS